jgi:hypothetical protein
MKRLIVIYITLKIAIIAIKQIRRTLRTIRIIKTRGRLSGGSCF